MKIKHSVPCFLAVFVFVAVLSAQALQAPQAAPPGRGEGPGGPRLNSPEVL